MKYALLLGCLLALIGGCNKPARKEHATEMTQTNTNILTKNRWMLTKQKAKYRKNGQTKAYSIPERKACQKDDIYRFMANGLFVIDEGKQSCVSPPLPENDPPLLVCTGGWLCYRDTLTIQLSEGDVLTYSIKTLTQDEMILEKEFILSNGQHGSLEQLFCALAKLN